jgi:hypothetical protein
MAREEHLVRMGEDSNKYRILVGRPEGRNHSEPYTYMKGLY